MWLTRIVCLAVLVTPCSKFANAALIFSGTLGQTNVAWDDLLAQTVPGTNVDGDIFVGVRFHINAPTITTRIGGHFVGYPNTPNNDFFAAIIGLTSAADFPDSSDLTTADVLGVTTLTFPLLHSAEAFGPLSMPLGPGWYALVFGGGLFGTSGSGAAVRNGLDIDLPTYIGWHPNDEWRDLSNFFSNHRFVVEGNVVPEPTSLLSMLTIVLFLWLSSGRHRSRS
jgi:hypothetical protein